MELATVKKSQLPFLHIEGKYYYAGSDCKFFVSSSGIDIDIGYKIYPSIQEAKKAFRLQLKFYKKKIAPRPGYLFLTYFDLRLYYGYTTQIASEINKSFYETHIGYFLREAGNIGLTFCDTKPENFGQINGRLVCVDFGKNSFLED